MGDTNEGEKPKLGSSRKSLFQEKVQLADSLWQVLESHCKRRNEIELFLWLIDLSREHVVCTVRLAVNLYTFYSNHILHFIFILGGTSFYFYGYHFGSIFYFIKELSCI